MIMYLGWDINLFSTWKFNQLCISQSHPLFLFFSLMVSLTVANMSIASHFSRFMNQYFLLIACLQLWSLITPVNPASTWGPLIFIFAVSASKEAWDDYNRYLSDKKANEKEVWVVRQGIKKHVREISNVLLVLLCNY